MTRMERIYTDWLMLTATRKNLLILARQLALIRALGHGRVPIS